MPDRVFRLTNTMTHEVEPLKLVEPGRLKFYSCGPTVYSYAHIGNFRTFLTADLIIRTAEALGWQVDYVSNITDVGHLTADDVADATGEDKMAKALHSKDGAQFANVWDLAEHYADAFKEDWDRLNLRRPMVWPRATQHMREQIVAIEKLIADGHAYATPTGVYFRLSSFADHGKLSGNRDKDALIVGARDVVQDDNKEAPGDFALWKLDDKHLMQWYSPWGWGFPGWHIECSVMAMQYLGETLDLHAGGEDLIFPHHESEIAQSECLTGKVFANHWIHTKFLQVDGEKMSKSKGNYFTARDIVDGKGADPLALRYALISVPYDKPANFTMQVLKDAGRNVERFREARIRAESAVRDGGPGDATLAEALDRAYEDALDAMCEDLNTSVALARALEGARIILSSDGMSKADGLAAQAFISRIDALLGVVPSLEIQTAAVAEPVIDGRPISELITERNRLKAERKFAESDALRTLIDEAGFELRDTPEGTVWKPKI